MRPQPDVYGTITDVGWPSRQDGDHCLHRGEDPLNETLTRIDGYIARAHERIARQNQLVTLFRAQGYTELLRMAEDLLGTLDASLAALNERRSAIVDLLARYSAGISREQAVGAGAGSRLAPPSQAGTGEMPGTVLKFTDRARVERAEDVPDAIADKRRIEPRQLQLLIDALPDAFLAVDEHRRIRFVSRQMEALFGYRAEELIGQKVEMLVPAERREQHAVVHTAYSMSPTQRPMGSGLDITAVTKDGREIPLDIGLAPVPTTDGTVVIAAIHDLRPQKHGEEQLRAARAAADRANQAKSRFLAAAGHDLRQPLQTFGLLLGVLEKRAVDPESRATLAKLDDAVADMADLLDTLLDMNQIESGKIKAEITDFPVIDLLRRTRDEFMPLALSKGLHLRVVPSSQVIRSDRRLLARMVGNLLSNAIKYTDRGKILLGCRRRGERLGIEVWDTGIGIPADSISAIFDEFYRVDRAGEGQFGMGLGLYIVQRFAQLLDHEVEVRSAPGRGTMFALVVARHVPAAARSRQSVPGTFAPTILVIAGDAAQRDALQVLLELEGYRVAATRNREEALSRIRVSPDSLPTAIVADHVLPGGVTGLQVIQDLRDQLDARIPAVIVSLDKSAATRRVIEGRGFAYVAKPVKAADLLATVNTLVKTVNPEWLSGTRQGTSAALPSPAPPEADIAVIDDEPGPRDALRIALEADGYRTASYASSEAFLADPGRRRFRCLVIDLALPGMDGFALQSRLKSEGLAVPLIFVTGNSDVSSAVKAMREGAADFLQKPVRGEDLRMSVARVLKEPHDRTDEGAEQGDIAARLATLTQRERQVMERILAGQANKHIAADLGISQRTTEHHRRSVMRKMGAKSLASLVRLVVPHLGWPQPPAIPPAAKPGA